MGYLGSGGNSSQQSGKSIMGQTDLPTHGSSSS